MFPTTRCEDNSNTSTTRWCECGADDDDDGGGGGDDAGGGGGQDVELAMVTYVYPKTIFTTIRFRGA